VTRHFIRALVALYTLGIGVLIYCAHTSYTRSSLLHTGLSLGLAVLGCCAIGVLGYLSGEARQDGDRT